MSGIQASEASDEQQQQPSVAPGRHKTCSRCSRTKVVSFFARRSASSDGFSSWCKQCFAEHAATKYQSDPGEQVAKCVIRCANCHQIVTSERAGWWRSRF